MANETRVRNLRSKGYRPSNRVVPLTLVKPSSNEVVQAVIANTDLIQLWSMRSEADSKVSMSLRMLAELQSAEDICVRRKINDDKLNSIVQKRKAIIRKTYMPAIEERARLDNIFWSGVRKALPEFSHLRLRLRLGQSGEYLLVSKIGFWSSLKIKLGFMRDTVLNDLKLV
jgi:hypothetical protein